MRKRSQRIPLRGVDTDRMVPDARYGLFIAELARDEGLKKAYQKLLLLLQKRMALRGEESQ